MIFNEIENMKKSFVLIMAAFLCVVGVASAQMPQNKGMYGIDHEKKIVVTTGRLPEGISPFKETIHINDDAYTYYRSEMPLITITTGR